MPAAYVAVNAENRNAPAEITLTIDALGLCSRWGIAASTRNTGPRRLTSMDFAYASGVKLPMSSRSAVAALFTTMSRRPKRSTVRSTSAWTASSSPMCVGTPMAWPPAAVSAASASAHESALRLATATLAPAATKPSAIDRPMPRVPPVTIATRPVRSNSFSTRSRSTAVR